VYEFLDLAKRLRRVLVEPCLLDGRLVPCYCGRVAPVVDWRQTADSDLLLLPALPLGRRFKHPRANVLKTHLDGRASPRDLDEPFMAYPLSAYVDVPKVLRYVNYEHMIPHDVFCGAMQWILESKHPGKGYGYASSRHGEDEDSGVIGNERVERMANPSHVLKVGGNAAAPDAPPGSVGRRMAGHQRPSATASPKRRSRPADPSPPPRSTAHPQAPLVLPRFEAPFVYCQIAPSMMEWCGDGPIGDFYYAEYKYLPAGLDATRTKLDPEPAVHMVSADKNLILAITQARPRFWSPEGTYPALPLAELHYVAAERFIRLAFGSRPFVAFHWRTERIPFNHLESQCVDALVDMAKTTAFVKEGSKVATWKRLVNSSRKRSSSSKDDVINLGYTNSSALLLMDMPATRSRPLWQVYVVSTKDVSKTHSLVRKLMDGANMVKYDAEFDSNAMDDGVLGLRDFALAVLADDYITCDPGEIGDRNWGTFAKEPICHGCFWKSRFARRVMEVRSGQGKPLTDRWFNLSPGRGSNILKAFEADIRVAQNA
jgi:hypothetical protein